MSEQPADNPNSFSGNDHGLPAAVVDHILRAVGSIRYGSVEITVHDGKVLQIERKEKVRFHQDTSSPRR